MLDSGKTPEGMLEEVLGELGVEVLDQVDLSYQCDCSAERVEKALISIGKKDLEEMINDGEEIEVKCQFCDKKYNFSVEELKNMYKKAKA
jgi:molecular chaperone Hsp33